MFKTQEPLVSNVTACILHLLATYMNEKKLLKLLSLLNHIDVKTKDRNFLFEGQSQTESKFCFILTDAWTPLSPTRQSKNQCKHTNTLLAIASSWKTIAYHKSSLATEICQSISFVLACNCPQGKKSSNRTPNNAVLLQKPEKHLYLQMRPYCAVIPVQVLFGDFCHKFNVNGLL